MVNNSHKNYAKFLRNDIFVYCFNSALISWYYTIIHRYWRWINSLSNSHNIDGNGTLKFIYLLQLKSTNVRIRGSRKEHETKFASANYNFFKYTTKIYYKSLNITYIKKKWY